uniref:Zn(2)-C6 fungal-type domain-containing protein n=1 Tax=Kwoniella bestiolae CBS 10118 TaxID=1296100 RepID=A0A1B9GBG8_9TREE|nr:hypothetical protein I302_03206 [Kwoniella bestiolae CBS 10118]OCF28347.1 hypothetical protein I302_03206 [Kwoniella bestiolae CBS 10118]
MSAAPEEPKKKRRQNVACSCCKLRRIKCDLSDLLNSLPTSSSSPLPSLSELVEKHPEVGCTNCKKKGLKCDTQGIREPTRPNKGGKRIEEAKRKFGQDEERDHEINKRDQNSGIPDSQTVGQDETQIQMPFDPLEVFSNHSIIPSSSQVLPSSNEPHIIPLQDPGSFTFFDPTVLQTFDPSPDPPDPPVHLQPPTTIVPQGPQTPGPPSNFQEAASIWQQFANNRKEAMYLVRTTGLTPGADGVQLSVEDEDLMGGLQSRVSDYMADLHSPLSGVTQGFSDSSLLGQFTPATSSTAGPVMGMGSDHYDLDTDLMFGLGDKRKRGRSPHDSGLGNRKMVLLSSNPWKLYSDIPQSQLQMVSWGRREAVGEQLADRALGMALSNHLVKVFFEAVHLSYPAISPEVFYLEWMKAGQRSDRMTPAQEALCSVIEAWGARYSDSPVILGMDEAKAHAAPKVIKADGTFTPGTRARTHWGIARRGACKALLVRAKRMIDDHGLFRRPSITGVQALTLYNQLMHMTDEKLLEKDYWLQNHMTHSTIIEQMRLLGLMWDTDMKQRRLFWTHMIGDAFFSASIGALPKMSQEDVDAAGEWVETVQDRLPHSSFKLLSFFLLLYHRLGLAGREVAIHVAYPQRKKGAADVGKICMTIRKVWKDVVKVSRDMNVKVTEYLQACRKEDLMGFSPLNFLANLRLSCPFLLLVIHQLIRDQLEFWKNFHSHSHSSSAFIDTPSDGASSTSSASSRAGRGNTPALKNIELLERLNKESVDGLLFSCRGQIAMLKSILPTGVIQSASILLRVLLITAQLLAEVPTNEQGYPNNTPGGYGWTWEAKQREIDVCLDALHQVGWAWADVAEVCDTVALTMERMTPSPEQISTWKANQPQNNDNGYKEGIAKMKEADAQASEKAVNAVLVFWPPVSIPNLIEHALMKNPKLLDQGIPIMANQFQQPRYDISSMVRAQHGSTMMSSWEGKVDDIPQANQQVPHEINIQHTTSASDQVSMSAPFIHAHFDQSQGQPSSAALGLDSLLDMGMMDDNSVGEGQGNGWIKETQQPEQLDIDAFLRELGIPQGTVMNDSGLGVGGEDGL